MIRLAPHPVLIGITIHAVERSSYMTSPEGQPPRDMGGTVQSGTSAATSPDAPAGTPSGTALGGISGPAAEQYVPRQATRYEAAPADPQPRGAVLGFTIFAAVVMMLSGIWDFFAGLAAVIRGSFFVVLPHYAFEMSTTAWGWFHLILGAVVFVAGAALLTDALWARIVGIVLVSVSAIVNFLYIPYQPVWSIVVIALDVAVLWALLTPRRYR
jgi:hypothetical protein